VVASVRAIGRAELPTAPAWKSRNERSLQEEGLLLRMTIFADWNVQTWVATMNGGPGKESELQGGLPTELVATKRGTNSHPRAYVSSVVWTRRHLTNDRR
jgi:hypothetical protein